MNRVYRMAMLQMTNGAEMAGMSLLFVLVDVVLVRLLKMNNFDASMISYLMIVLMFVMGVFISSYSYSLGIQNGLTRPMLFKATMMSAGFLTLMFTLLYVLFVRYFLTQSDALFLSWISGETQPVSAASVLTFVVTLTGYMMVMLLGIFTWIRYVRNQRRETTTKFAILMVVIVGIVMGTVFTLPKLFQVHIGMTYLLGIALPADVFLIWRLRGLFMQIEENQSGGFLKEAGLI